ncbi:MAG: hypothetical protein WC799_25495 [Desulfobacteraceae bacterium]
MHERISNGKKLNEIIITLLRPFIQKVNGLFPVAGQNELQQFFSYGFKIHFSSIYEVHIQ